ncbi:FG-GAP repeat protein [Streptomyces sp. NPDC057496]|uniref:FG-GAP and VCBS repeat-containing protein n=1 Tax=Streptomyces sp. NPDC057496 TaxID=3346149 RepID=UPI0036B86DEC
MSGIVAVIGLLVATGSATAAGAVPAAAAASCAGASTDFNGDGLVDNVVTDPQATVGGVPQAGLVRVLYGGDRGVSEISQATPGMGVSPERGDQFGSAVAWTDFNGDGCSDLVIGTPYEDTGGSGADIKDTGCLHIVYGSPTGIGAGSTVEGYTQLEQRRRNRCLSVYLNGTPDPENRSVGRDLLSASSPGTSASGHLIGREEARACPRG